MTQLKVWVVTYKDDTYVTTTYKKALNIAIDIILEPGTIPEWLELVVAGKFSEALDYYNENASDAILIEQHDICETFSTVQLMERAKKLLAEQQIQ